MQQLSLSNIIEQIFDPERGPSTYGQLINEIDQHGMAVVLILFALPSALPLPAAGYSTVLSIPLFIIGFRLIFGYNTLWLPNRLQNKTFNPEQFSRKLVHSMLRLIHFVEHFSKPRLVPFVRSQGVYRLLGILIIALACSMLLPIPGTNTAPAFGIFLIGFALLEDDGVMLIVGIVASLVALAVSVTIIFFGYKSILFLKDALRGFF
ncbi:MAG: exopolysaccharide biosynthesis protein [Candidatus Tectomicrobia bacterium]|nr:exopolysaccharide biosynthesis protein [Candidatus Tectomicrobia bacterium]